ncbi:hypothetical protein IAU59_000437 [Kwoniella sp. CBS 9459]
MTSITDSAATPFSPLVLFDEFNWPPLPEITDKQLKQTVLTHRSAISSMGLDMVGDNESYDTLAHVGDSLLNTFITCLLHTNNPKRKVGIATDLRSKLVNRQINTHISQHYGLPERVRTGRAQRGTFLLSDEEAGEVYEAYLAGLFLSYAKSGQNGSGDPQGATNVWSHGKAFDKLGQFLVLLYTPLVENLQSIYDSNPNDSLGAVEALVELAEGSKAELNLYAQKKHLELPVYSGERIWPGWIPVHHRVGDHGKVHKGTCTVHLGQGRTVSKEAVGNGNLKSAHNVAAYLVLQELRSMAEFAARQW